MKIIPKKDCNKRDQRFVIADDEGTVVDDAQGYGYKTKQKAYKAMYYKFQGGKQKDKEKKTFFRKNLNIKEAINKIYELNFKEIARGEITQKDIKEEIDKKFNIDLPKSYLL